MKCLRYIGLRQLVPSGIPKCQSPFFVDHLKGVLTARSPRSIGGKNDMTCCIADSGDWELELEYDDSETALTRHIVGGQQSLLHGWKDQFAILDLRTVDITSYCHG